MCTIKTCLVWSISKEKKSTKRKASKKQLFTFGPASEINIGSLAVESSNEIFPSTSGANKTNEPDISIESNVEMDQGKKVEDLKARLLHLLKRGFSRMMNWRERLPKTNSTRRQCLPVYFLSIVSSPMQMLAFILAFPIMPVL